MKAAYYEAFRQPVRIVELPDPEPPADGVVIRVMATGLCRSDWHGWMGHDADVHLPHVPGHELAGIIESVGPEVKNWEAGARVTVPFCLGCGHCRQCRAGQQQVCDDYYQPGFTGWGSFAEYVALPHADANLVRLPPTVSFVEAAILGCRFITSYRAIIDQGRLRAGDWVAVHGCGGVGLSAIMIARAAGARVLAVDIDDQKLAFAKKTGAVHLLNARKIADIPAAVKELTSGGAHLSVDALGSIPTCVNSILSLRKRGRHLQVGLMAGEHRLPPIPMGPVIANELEIIGSHGMQAHAFPGMMRLITSGQLQPKQLLGKTISLEEAPRELERMGDFTNTGVTVIEMESQ